MTKGWQGIFFFLLCCVLVVQAQHGNLLAAHGKGSNELEPEFRSREQDVKKKAAFSQKQKLAFSDNRDLTNSLKDRHEFRTFQEKGDPRLQWHQAVHKNSTSIRRTDAHKKKWNDKTVLALIVLVAIFGLVILAIVVVCLIYRYRARFDGYTLMTWKDSKKKRTGSISKDYIQLDTIFEEEIFTGDDQGTFSDCDDTPENNDTQESRNNHQNFGENPTEGQGKNTAKGIPSIKTSNMPAGLDRISPHTKAELIQPSLQQIERKYKNHRRWSLQAYKDKATANQNVQDESYKKSSFPYERKNDSPIHDNNLSKTSGNEESENPSSFFSKTDLELGMPQQLSEEKNYSDYGEMSEGWDGGKRGSIQAKAYVYESESDDDYTVNDSLEDSEAVVERESGINLSSDNNNNNDKTLSDSIMHADYASTGQEEPSAMNESSLRFTGSTNSSNKDGDFDWSVRGYENIGSAAGIGIGQNCDFGQDVVHIRDNAECSENRDAGYMDSSMQLSKDEIKGAVADVKVKPPPSIHDKDSKGVLHRANSDSKLVLESAMNGCDSCLSLKSFSTSNLQEIHQSALPNSTAEAENNPAQTVQKRKKLRLKNFKKFFKMKKKAK